MYTRRGYEGTEATSLSIETPCRTGALCHASQHCVRRRLTRDLYAAGRQAMMTKELKKRHTAFDRVTSYHVASLALHFYHTPTTRPVNEHYSHVRLLCVRLPADWSVPQRKKAVRIAARSFRAVRLFEGKRCQKGVLDGRGRERVRSACVFWAAGPNVDCTIGLYRATRNHHHYHYLHHHHYYHYRRHHSYRRRRRRRLALAIDFSAQPPRPEHIDRRRLLDSSNIVACYFNPFWFSPAHLFFFQLSFLFLHQPVFFPPRKMDEVSPITVSMQPLFLDYRAHWFSNLLSSVAFDFFTWNSRTFSLPFCSTSLNYSLSELFRFILLVFLAIIYTFSYKL